MPKDILIVDDSAVVRAALRMMLETQFGWHVCAEASDGRQGIAKAQQLHPDLIVLDLSMPVMNGLDAAHELKRLLPYIPVVLYTDYEANHVKDIAKSEGIRAIVPKSAPRQLVNVMQGILEPAA
jgi:DNA-binding NarL/FixJ family response regulator